MAQVIDMFHAGNGAQAALREFRHRSGSWFNRQLVRVGRFAAGDLRLKRAQCIKVLDDYFDNVAAAFTKDMIAGKMGFPAERRRWLKRTALLHGIAASSGSATPFWIYLPKSNAMLSEVALSRLTAFRDLASIAPRERHLARPADKSALSRAG